MTVQYRTERPPRRRSREQRRCKIMPYDWGPHYIVPSQALETYSGNVRLRERLDEDELEKELRFKTVERFGGKKGDLSRAVEEAVKTWVAKER